MLNIHHFTKSYDGKTKACDNITLTVETGDIFGFIGHNGAGEDDIAQIDRRNP